MRRFEVIDGAKRNALPCAVLNWDDKNAKGISLSIDISENARKEDVPMLFVPFVRENKLHIGDKWAKRWIEERIVPPSRQNLGEVLRANDLEFYDAMALFVAGDGKCEQDDFFIREVKPLSNCETQSLAQQIGNSIKVARKEAGLTQYELAKAAKITQPALSNLENGHGNPTVGLLEDISGALGMKIDISLK